MFHTYTRTRACPYGMYVHVHELELMLFINEALQIKLNQTQFQKTSETCFIVLLFIIYTYVNRQYKFFKIIFAKLYHNK